MLAAMMAAALVSAMPDTTPHPVSLDEAVAMAQRNALVVVQAEGAARTSAAASRAASAAFIPSVSLSAGATRQLPAGARTRVENGQVVTLPSTPWSSNVGLGANVALFEGGRRIFELSQARARVRSSAADLEARRFDAVLAAKQNYFDILAAREARSAAAAQLAQAEQQFRFAVARVHARTATRSDSLRAIIQLRSARQAVSDARSAEAVANISLTRTVGAEQLLTAAPGESLGGATLSVDEPTLHALAEGGPSVKAAEADLQAAQAGRRISWSAYLPSLTASYSRTGSGAGQTLLPDDGFGYSGALRFALSFPLFDQFQREEQRTQASVQAEQAAASLRDARLAVRQSLTQALSDWHSAAQRAAGEVASVEAAEEDLRVQQQRYNVGGSTLLDVLTSQTQLDQARRDLIRARYDQRVAKARIESLVGRSL